jgi:hypothetical protein
MKEKQLIMEKTGLGEGAPAPELVTPGYTKFRPESLKLNTKQ